MFHWICPECGREIAPTIRECPACDPVAATVEAAPAGEVEAPARAGNEAAAQALSASPPTVGAHPEPKPLEPIAPVAAATVTPPVHAAPPDATPPHALAPHAAPPLTEPPLTEPSHAAPPALAERVESVSPSAARNAHSFSKLEGTQGVKREAKQEAPLPQFGTPSQGGDPLGHLSLMVSSMLGSTPDSGTPEPPPSREALPLPMRTASNMPASLRAFIAELRPAGAAPAIPLTPGQQRQTAPEPPLLTNPIPIPLRPARHAPAPPLGSKLLAFPVETTQSAQPSTPPWEPAPPLAPLGDYSPLEAHPLRPAIPQVQLLKKECGPRTTLPGPMLTRRLVKFMDRELGSIPPPLLRAKKRLIPGWMATALILGTVLGAGFTSVLSVVRPALEARTAAAAQTNSGAAAASTPELASASGGSLAKAIEVTGFRIQMDPAKKSAIQYLVVNHTAARFSGVTVYVTLYTADAKAGQPPLCKFQFTAPTLAPFQAKDMTSSIEGVTRPVPLLDWQDLRATVEIGE